MAVLAAFGLIIALWAASYIRTFFNNWQAARASGLPYIICPINPDTVPYMILKRPLLPYYRRYLPKFLYERLRLTIYEWGLVYRYRIHEKLGPCFVLVTFGGRQIMCADPTIAASLLGQRKVFKREPMAGLVIGVLGPNVFTDDGESWARQRRIIASNLNEKISQIVWKESIGQGRQMADYMLSQPNGQTREIVSSLKGVAINVLGEVGYGQPKPFSPVNPPCDPKAKLSYIDAVSLVAELLYLAPFIPIFILSLPIMPPIVQTLGSAMKQAPQLVQGLLDDERARDATNSTGRDTFLSQLVRLSDKEKGQSDQQDGEKRNQYLSEEEIRGNLFLFTGAGYDTTANTMVFAMIMLTVHPEWQTWIQEEIDEVFKSRDSNEELDYTSCYPRMVRCLAVMYETLRLYPPVQFITVYNTSAQTVTDGTKQYMIPSNTITHMVLGSLHTRPDIWGKDSLQFRPSRWISDQAQLIQPQRGAFLPWSGGPRVCPGQKMSQVEFVTVFANLFERCNVQPVLEAGETLEDGKRRLEDIAQDSITKLTLQVKDPAKVHLKWTRR